MNSRCSVASLQVVGVVNTLNTLHPSFEMNLVREEFFLCLSSLLALNYYWHGLFTGIHSEKPADVGEGIEHILNRKQEG